MGTESDMGTRNDVWVPGKMEIYRAHIPRICTLDIFFFPFVIPALTCSLFAKSTRKHFASMEEVVEMCFLRFFLVPKRDESSYAIVEMSAWSSINGNVKWVNYSVNVWGKWCEMWHANNNIQRKGGARWTGRCGVKRRAGEVRMRRMS